MLNFALATHEYDSESDDAQVRSDRNLSGAERAAQMTESNVSPSSPGMNALSDVVPTSDDVRPGRTGLECTIGERALADNCAITLSSDFASSNGVDTNLLQPTLHINAEQQLNRTYSSSSSSSLNSEVEYIMFNYNGGRSGIAEPYRTSWSDSDEVPGLLYDNEYQQTTTNGRPRHHWDCENAWSRRGPASRQRSSSSTPLRELAGQVPRLVEANYFGPLPLDMTHDVSRRNQPVNRQRNEAVNFRPIVPSDLDDDFDRLPPEECEFLSLLSLRRRAILSHHFQWQGEARMCAVCLEDIERGMQVNVLKCCHLFHSSCINRWFQAEPRCSCPMCRNMPF